MTNNPYMLAYRDETKKKKIMPTRQKACHSIINAPIVKLTAPIIDATLASRFDPDAPFNVLPAVGLAALTQMLLAKLSLSGLYCCDGKSHTDMMTSISLPIG